jgi:GAF domain-containing protein
MCLSRVGNRQLMVCLTPQCRRVPWDGVRGRSVAAGIEWVDGGTCPASGKEDRGGQARSVKEDRASQIWASIYAVARVEGASLSVRHVCLACVRAVEAVGAGLSMTRGPDLREPVFATEPISQELEELQFTLGEGPSVDAIHRDEPVLVADLSIAQCLRRWPMFAPAATERKIRGMLAIPVRVGAARLGVLDLYWLTAGPLSLEKLAIALAYADALLLLALNDRGGVAPDLESFGAGGLAEWRTEVHQATGMVSVQLGVDVTEALIRLRAHAYLHDQRLADVAADVVARRLRFRPDGGSEGGRAGDTSLPDGPDHNGAADTAPPTGMDKEGEA